MSIISGFATTFANPNPRFLNSFSFPKFTPNCGSKIRVYATPQSIVTQFSAPSAATTSSEKKSIKDDEDKREYYLNMGYAIRCLREEFPQLFYRDLTFDIYRDDIVFKDPLNTFAGIENYKSIFWALRFNGRIFFKALWIEILSIWQPMDNVILIRWTIHGIPRVPWESRGRFDGISEYKLDKNGKIYEHKVDNIALNSLGKFQVLSVQELILSLGRPSVPKPTCFEISSSTESAPLMNSARHYMDFSLDLLDRREADICQKS